MNTPFPPKLSARLRAVSVALMLVSTAWAEVPAQPATAPTVRGAMFEISPKVRELGFYKGFAWGFPGLRGDYMNPESLESMRRARETGADWLCISFSSKMENTTNPEIFWSERNPAMVTDDEIRHAVRQAHGLGFKVVLKPMVDPYSGEWRGRIKFADDQGWATFFENYHAMMVHYARIAAETKCEMIALGCEMQTATAPRFDEQWRSLIAKVRDVYPGVLTYNANHGGEVLRVGWWDAVDVISVSAYYGVGDGPDSTVEQMMKSWEPEREHLANVAYKFKRPVFFIEIGMMSTRGMSKTPAHWEPGSAPGREEQARYYEAVLRSFWDEPWFLGFFWWKWDAVLSRPETSSMNTKRASVVGENGFRIVGKPAEALVREWYAKPRPVPSR